MDIDAGRRATFPNRRPEPLDGPWGDERRVRAFGTAVGMPREDVFDAIQGMIVDFKPLIFPGGRGRVGPASVFEFVGDD